MKEFDQYSKILLSLDLIWKNPTITKLLINKLK
jgi:hypothetical protein